MTDGTGSSRTPHPDQSGPRSRGAVSGLLLILLGAWGALCRSSARTSTTATAATRLGTGPPVAVGSRCCPARSPVGGFLLLTSKTRIRGSFGGWLAALAGAWFLIGKTVATWWHTGGVGEPLSQHVSGRAVADLGTSTAWAR